MVVEEATALRQAEVVMDFAMTVETGVASMKIG
jgi:hypothetical protein